MNFLYKCENDKMGSSNHWTFLTNHTHVLLCIAWDPEMRVRDIAPRVGITQRAVQRIVSDLVHDGYLIVDKHGRRNHYTVRTELPLRHPVEHGALVSDLIALAHEPQVTS